MRNIEDSYHNHQTDTIIVKPNAEVPAMSFAKIVSYDKTNCCFNIIQPDVRELATAKVVVVPELIKSGEKGIGILSGIGVVLMKSGETVAAGDIVCTETSSWEAVEVAAQSTGGFYCMLVDSSDLVIRMGGTLGGGGAARIAYCKTNAPATNQIVCFLDVDTTGEEVTVTCLIHNSTRLDYAIPYLADGDPILVFDVGGTWYSWPYQGVKDYAE